MKTAVLGILVLLPACSGADADESCDLAHRNGTYVAHFTERDSGTCGAIGDQVLEINSASALPPGCALDAPDRMSADQCDLTRKYTCPLDGVEGTISATGITTESGGGSKFSGLLTAIIKDNAGAFVCSSTYDVSYERQ